MFEIIFTSLQESLNFFSHYGSFWVRCRKHSVISEYTRFFLQISLHDFLPLTFRFNPLSLRETVRNSSSFLKLTLHFARYAPFFGNRAYFLEILLRFSSPPKFPTAYLRCHFFWAAVKFRYSLTFNNSLANRSFAKSKTQLGVFRCSSVVLTTLFCFKYDLETVYWWISYFFSTT